VVYVVRHESCCTRHATRRAERGMPRVVLNVVRELDDSGADNVTSTLNADEMGSMGV
jgi:hypothetical protein